ncbi:MAG: hypothetical protein LBP58_07040 [Azoarcus sp.]|nr:hypothetical protein [Azoarcus sp.]
MMEKKERHGAAWYRCVSRHEKQFAARRRSFLMRRQCVMYAHNTSGMIPAISLSSARSPRMKESP